MSTSSIATLGSQLYTSVRDSKGKGATVFLGAGASLSSGIPTWKELCRVVCANFSIPVPENDSPIDVIVKVLQEEQSSQTRYELLSSHLNAGHASRGYHHLAQLAAEGYISTIFTTNWDCLLEASLTRQIPPHRLRVLVRGLVPDEIIAKALRQEGSDHVTVVKLHGDIATRQFFITPNEVRRLHQDLMTEIAVRMRGMSFVVGASVHDVDILTSILSAEGRVYMTSHNPQHRDEIVSLLRRAGVTEVSGEQKVVTKNSTEVNAGDFDHFFSQLNLKVQIKATEASRGDLAASEQTILSKERIGQRYLNNTQINELVELFWKKIQKFSPGHVVFINDRQAPGGQELKRRLAPHLQKASISFEDIIVEGEAQSRSFRRKAEGRPIASTTLTPEKVLVLDAITFSGRTLEIARSAVEEWFPHAVVRCGVLVISQHLLAQKRVPTQEIFYQQVTDRFEIFFPWGVTQTTSDFDRVFPHARDTRTVRINKRPWGAVERLAEEEFCSVRLLVIEAGSKLSFQRHLCRDELYVALDDHIGLKIAGHLENAGTIDEYDPQINSLILEKGDYVLIPRGVWHRPEASMDRARILEIGFGVYDQTFDIERLFDRFGREEMDGGQ